MSQPFMLGVNYWPRRKAMYWWSNFDAGEVRDEFALIRALGLKAVRIFLLWDDFQPEADSISKSALHNLVKVADLAFENDLVLDITFFTGHMSGTNWCPRWLLGDPLPGHEPPLEVVSRGKRTPAGYRNMFHDPNALVAERSLLQTIVMALKDHPAIWIWNLGNEPDLFDLPASSDAGSDWVREMTGTIKSLDTIHPVTIGLHADSLRRDNGFRIDQVFRHTDVAVMHSYPMYVPWARQPLDVDFVPFTVALTSALCGQPVLMEEFGGCTAQPGQESYVMKWTDKNGQPRQQFMASEADFAEFIRLTLPLIHALGAAGALLWCFADYVPELWDRPPCRNAQHERFFGLVRPDGSLKPHAQVIRKFAETAPLVKAPPAWARMDVSGTEYYEKGLFTELPRLYSEYLSRKEMVLQGN